MEKKDIRKEILRKRNALSLTERERADELIRKQLWSRDSYKEAQWLFVYVSYKSEVDTLEIIKKALKQNKKIAVPKVLSSGYMEFYEISKAEELIEGYQGILEPDITNRQPIFAEKTEGKVLMILPGAVFDRKGNRIGYGGGFYDRYLERSHNCLLETVALAYEMQMAEQIPTENFDKKVQCIITEQGIYSK